MMDLQGQRERGRDACARVQGASSARERRAALRDAVAALLIYRGGFAGGYQGLEEDSWDPPERADALLAELVAQHRATAPRS